MAADPNLPTILCGDENRVKQCVLNILTNAVKYTKEGSVTMKVSFERKSEDTILLTFHVKDTGIGIKEEDIPRLTKPFERIEEERNRNIEGTGLGMSIVTQLLDLMGSRLELESVYGVGSDFHFTIEQKVVRDDPIGNFSKSYQNYIRESTKYKESFRAPSAKILAVDDTKVNLVVLKGLLKETQMEITTASSGAEALEAVKKEGFDIIFLDQRMPGMDGIQTLEKMRQLENNLSSGAPVIMLTATAQLGAREEFLRKGFTDYLSKPIDSTKLKRMVRHYLPPEKVILEGEEGRSGGGAANESVPSKYESDFLNHMASVEGVDVDMGIENCVDEDIYMDAVKSFVSAHEKNIKDLETFKEQKDLKNYTILVHGIKSSSRLIGAAGLSDLSRNLEDWGNLKETKELEAYTPGFIEKYNKITKDLKAALEEAENEKDKEGKPHPPIGKGRLEEGYAAIKEFVDGFDFDSAKDVYDMLSEYTIPKDEEERFKKTGDLLYRVDGEGIRNLL